MVIPITKDHSWEEVARIAQAQRDDSISLIRPAIPDVPSSLPFDITKLFKELLTEDEIRITQKFTEDLVEELAAGRLSSTTVTKAFLRRAGLAQKLVAQCYLIPYIFITGLSII